MPPKPRSPCTEGLRHLARAGDAFRQLRRENVKLKKQIAQLEQENAKLKGPPFADKETA
jgi:hypothetical protein